MTEGSNQQGQTGLAARIADALAHEYKIEGEIGRGGMGVVYSARDLKLNRRVAIKVLPPDLAFRDEIRRRFLREAQTAARLSHPNIVPIHTVGEGDGLVYFVMGYVDGESLGARLRRRRRLPVEEARRVLKETADALGLAHTMGVIHRDVKPDNVLLEGTRRRVMVTDFGIAKALEGGAGTLTGTGVALGTPSYMSPEQAAGESDIDARSDIYSLGIVGYEMVTGEVPFKAPTVPAILMKQVTEAPPDLLERRPECPEELAATIMRCLEKDPGNRWSTADAFRRALESRSSVPYRRPRGRRLQPAPDSSRSRAAPSARQAERRPYQPHRRRRELARREPAGHPKESNEADNVRKFRGHFASYVSVNGSLLLLNIVTGIGDPWFLVPAIAWGIGIASQYGKLWADGYSWRDVIHRPPAKDALEAQFAPERVNRAKKLARPSTGEYGKYTAGMTQLRNDHNAIVQMVERLRPEDRAMLPEVVPTVKNLYKKAADLGRTLAQMEGEVDARALEQIQDRIEALERDAVSPGDKRLELLIRQRDSMTELIERKKKVEAKFESYVLMIQNVRFELLRLRSAGASEVLQDITSVTQQAKALEIDVAAAIDAAGEIREVMNRGG